MEEDGAFRADAVVTFVAPKRAHVFGHLTAGTFGAVVVAGIGEPLEAVASETGLSWAGASKTIAEKPRGVDGNKGKFGHVLVVGGAYGKAGAPAMASAGLFAGGGGAGDGGGSAGGAGDGGGDCAGVDDAAFGRAGAGGARVQGSGRSVGGLGLDQLEAESLEKLLKGISVVAVGAGAGAGGDDSGVCAGAGGEGEAGDGDRCGWAECVCCTGLAAERCSQGANDRADAAPG